MTKFESEDDPGFKAVAGEIRRWVRALNTGLHHAEIQGDGKPSNASRLDRPRISITQGGSVFKGPVTISGGVLFQGNCVGFEHPVLGGS